MRKRYHTPKAKPGELRALYGKADRWSGPDVCYVWGEGVPGCDARLLHSTLSNKRLTLDFPNAGHKFEQSFVDELEERGYDITTLRFSIQKKPSANT